MDVVAQGYNGLSAAYLGQQYLDLVGFGNTGGVSSQFNTNAGQRYVVQFAYANNPWRTSTASANVRVVSGGTSNTLLFSEVTHSGSTTDHLGWLLYSGSFIADGSSSTIRVARHGKLPPQRHEELPPPQIAEERANEAGTNHGRLAVE